MQSNEFSMIKVEFSELEDESLLNAASVAEYVGVEFKSKNGELKMYQATLTIVFFIANLINLASYWYKLAQTPKSEIGIVQKIILICLALAVLFNLPYKLVFKTELLLYDAFVSSLTETSMLFLNLILSHSMYASANISEKVFYGPKMALSFLVFLSLWTLSYADALEY